MEKIKSYLQYVIKPWYKARDFVEKHPNVALFVLLAVALLNLMPR